MNKKQRCSDDEMDLINFGTDDGVLLIPVYTDDSGNVYTDDTGNIYTAGIEDV